MTESRSRNPAWGWVIGNHTVLGLTCAIVYLLVDAMQVPFIRETPESRAVGAIWAVIAAIFVFKETADDRLRVSLTRVIATSLSFILCEVYLLLFPFSSWGLAAVIAIGGILATMLRRPGDAGLTAITTTVILVVAGLGPAEDAWQQPILRLADTLIGIVIGFTAASGWSAIHHATARRGRTHTTV